MIVLICGGRDYRDSATIARVLDELYSAPEGVTAIVHGDAPGADTEADWWAHRRGVQRVKYPAPWERGRHAGPQRNEFMLRHAKPDLVVAFPGGFGTHDMVSRARKAGVRVVCVQDAGPTGSPPCVEKRGGAGPAGEH
jgi:hypothetical protein